MTGTGIGDALFTKTQQRVLGLLYGQPDKSFYTNEIVRSADMGRGTVRRELERLVAAGIIVVRREGNQHHYQANPDCPIYLELLGIVKKTFGIVDVIREALSHLPNQIYWAFIFGSVASGKATAASDIDLMIIGDISFTDVVSATHDAQEALGREINPKVYSKEEWDTMIKRQDAFIKEVMAKPKLFIVGDEHGLG